MGALESRDDAFAAGQKVKGLERLVVGRRPEIDLPRRLQPGHLGPDTGIVEPGGDGMGFGHLTLRVLQDEGVMPVQHSHPAGGHGGRMPAGIEPLACGLYRYQAHRVVEKGAEQAEGVTPPADAGRDGVG
jgi:hypothetical protein